MHLMKKLFLVLFTLFFSCISIAQQKLNFKKANGLSYKTQKRNGQSPSPLSSPFSDTLTNYFDDFYGPANLVIYQIDNALPIDTGYIAGTNTFGITETTERYSLPVGGTLNSVLFGFGKAVGSGNFNVIIRTDNAGAPGSVLETFTVAINQTDTLLHSFNHFIPVMQVSWNCAATLPTPITFSAGASFWAGLSASNNSGDTIALLSTETGGQTNPSH